MGLLGTTSEASYYTSSQRFSVTENTQSDFVLTVRDLPATKDDFILTVNGVEIATQNYNFPKANTTNTIEFTSGIPVQNDEVVVNFVDRQLGDYRYVKLKDIVNNFMVAYVGDGKLINYCNRSDILFHAKRGVAEFSYDVQRVEKIQEVDIGPDLTVSMPQDYISYVMLSWIDSAGLEHPIFPSTLTSRPSQSVAQDHDGEYLFKSETGDLLEITPSETQTKFANFDLNTFSGNLATDDYWIHTHYMHSRMPQRGSRYGLDPTAANANGVFVIDEFNGQFGFSADLAGKTITIKYISDGLAQDNETKIHKYIEDALYKYIVFNVLSTKAGIPEYIINRYRKEKRAATRNAKIRLSKFNPKYFINTMRGKSKHIKH